MCLQYKPQFIASAAIYLASKFLKYTLAPDGKKAWWEVLDAKIEELEGMVESDDVIYRYSNCSGHMIVARHFCSINETFTFYYRHQ